MKAVYVLYNECIVAVRKTCVQFTSTHFIVKMYLPINSLTYPSMPNEILQGLSRTDSITFLWFQIYNYSTTVPLTKTNKILDRFAGRIPFVLLQYFPQKYTTLVIAKWVKGKCATYCIRLSLDTTVLELLSFVQFVSIYIVAIYLQRHNQAQLQ